MKITSGKDIDIDDSLGVTIHVLETEPEEYISTFYMIFPDRDQIALQEFEALLEGMDDAGRKIRKLVERLELVAEDAPEEDEE